MTNEIVKKGELFQTSSGEYDDYMVDDTIYRAIKDFDVDNVYDAFYNTLPKQMDAMDKETLCTHGFTKYLKLCGYIKDIGKPYIFHIDNDVEFNYLPDETSTDRYTRGEK